MTDQLKRPVHMLLVDDHPAVRESLAYFLEGEEIAICAQAGTRAEALKYLDSGVLDLALIDLSIADDSLLLISDLHGRGVPVIVCSDQEGAAHVRRALGAGARAYVAKREAGTLLAQVIRDVLNGWMLVSPRAGDEL